MGTRERRERERQAMEVEIIGTALALVRAEGAANLSAREVAKRMEYSSAALYRYFPDKAALVAAVCRRGFAELAARVRAVPADRPPAERLVAQGEAYLRFAADEPHLYTLMFVDVLPGPVDGTPVPVEALLDDPAFASLHGTLADGAAAGQFRLAPADLLPASVAAWALVHGYAMLNIRYPGWLSPALARAGLVSLAAGLAAGAVPLRPARRPEPAADAAARPPRIQGT